MPDAPVNLPLELAWRGLDEAFGELEEELTGVARGITVRLWDLVLARTPQYFGGLVASWTYTYNPGDQQDRSEFFRPTKWDQGGETLRNWVGAAVKSRGDTEAIGVANWSSAGAEDGFRLGRMVYMTNGADHGEGAYSVAIEEADPMSLRSVNRPGHAVARSLDTIHSAYSRGVSKRDAEFLKYLKIGS